MKEKIKYYIKEIVLFTIFITIVANAISLYKSQSLNHKPLTIEQFKLIDNSNVTLDKEKPILIHFWATWCPTCKIEAPNIAFIAKHFQVITIAVDSKSDADIYSYLKEHDYHFKTVNNNKYNITSQFKITGLPTSFIYDKSQTLRFSEVGYTSSIGLYLRLLWAEYL